MSDDISAECRALFAALLVRLLPAAQKTMIVAAASDDVRLLTRAEADILIADLRLRNA